MVSKYVFCIYVNILLNHMHVLLSASCDVNARVCVYVCARVSADVLVFVCVCVCVYVCVCVCAN